MKLKFSIVKKQVFINFILPLIVFISIGLMLYVSLKGVIKYRLEQENNAKAYQVRDSLEVVLAEKIKLLELISLLPEVSSYVVEISNMSDIDSLSEDEAYTNILDILNTMSVNENENVLNIASDLSKNYITSNKDGANNSSDIRDSKWYRGAVTSESTYVSELVQFQNGDSSRDGVYISYPIYSGNVPCGAVSIELLLTEITDLLKDAALYYNNDIILYSDHTGKILWSNSLDESQYSNITDIKSLLTPVHGENEASNIINQLKSFKSQSFEGLGEIGEVYLYQSVPVSFVSWGIIVSTPESIVNTSINDSILGPFSIALIVFILILMGGLLITFYSVVKPLHKTINRVKDLAEGEGDLTIEMIEHNIDETGLLANRFNQFVQKLKTMMLNVKGGIVQVQSIKEDIVANSQETASATHEISRNVDTINNQMIMLNDEIQTVSESMNNMTSLIEGLNNNTDEQNLSFGQSSAAVEEMIAQIRNVANVVNEKKSSTQELELAISKSESSLENAIDANSEIQEIAGEISDMSSVISNIASQTNLLSMNAAIEAAHAGDAGKGFSVVADEIRKLAENSRDNSNSINQLIKDVLDKVEFATRATTENEQTFKILSKEIRSTIHALDEINNTTKELNEGGEQILLANTQLNDISNTVIESAKVMSTTVEGMISSTTEVADISKSVTEGVKEISVGTSEISQAMNILQDIAQQLDDSSNSVEEETNKFKTE